jgi:hypothetical protein
MPSALREASQHMVVHGSSSIAAHPAASGYLKNPGHPAACKQPAVKDSAEHAGQESSLHTRHTASPQQGGAAAAAAGRCLHLHVGSATQ